MNQRAPHHRSAAPRRKTATLQTIAHENWDGRRFAHQSFSGCRLLGVNLSECVFDHVDFTGAELIDCVLAESVLTNCDFSEARFAGCVLTDARLSGCVFNTGSALTLPFADAQFDAEQPCFYRLRSGERFAFALAPIVLLLPYGVLTLWDDRLVIDGDISWRFSAYQQAYRKKISDWPMLIASAALEIAAIDETDCTPSRLLQSTTYKRGK